VGKYYSKQRNGRTVFLTKISYHGMHQGSACTCRFHWPRQMRHTRHTHYHPPSRPTRHEDGYEFCWSVGRYYQDQARTRLLDFQTRSCSRSILGRSPQNRLVFSGKLSILLHWSFDHSTPIGNNS